jgi:hypothetical protein
MHDTAAIRDLNRLAAFFSPHMFPLWPAAAGPSHLVLSSFGVVAIKSN